MAVIDIIKRFFLSGDAGFLVPSRLGKGRMAACVQEARQIALGLDFGGWAPHGWTAEDGTIPAQYRERMQEHPSVGDKAQNYRERIRDNVRDSHATLIFVDSLPLSGGAKLAADAAVAMMRSHKVIAMPAANAKDDALKWLRQFLGMSSALVLNVAGPRESKTPGIQPRAKAFLEELLLEVPQFFGQENGRTLVNKG